MLQAQIEDHYIRRSTIDCQIALVRQACNWLGIEKGRAKSYVKLLTELRRNNMSSEHTLSVNESVEITEIYELWHRNVQDFPGLDDKIREIFRSGPLLREDEKPDNSGNRFRNDAFSMLMAGRILEGGIAVLAVEGIVRNGAVCHSDADITCSVNQYLIDLQCKRPQSEGALEKRIDEAHKQLSEVARGRCPGAVAVDCSAFIRRTNTVIETDSLAKSAALVTSELERLARMVQPAGLFQDRMLIGVLFAANVPTMTRTGQSLVLAANGRPFTYFNTDTVRMIVGILNDASPSKHLLQVIGSKIGMGYRVPKGQVSA